MSTIRSYRVRETVAAAAMAAAVAELERRQAEVERQRQAIQASARLMERTQQEANRQLAGNKAHLDALQKSTDRLLQENDDLAARLDTARRAVSEIRGTTAGAVANAAVLAGSVDRAVADQTDAERRIADTQASLAGAEQQAVQAILETGDAAAALERTQAALSAQTARLSQLTRELDFLTQQRELLVPAVVTLSAMQSNGYVLRDTVTRDGLIAYFESADKGHDVAVRHRTAVTQGQPWELDAETFGLQGEGCLFVLDDFVAAAEETGIAELEPAGPARLPKRDGETGIPLPVYPTDDAQRVAPVQRDLARE